MRTAVDILLIEDSPSQALYFQLLLQRAGFSVQTASDGVQGFWSACADAPRMILLDVDLPQFNGFQVLSHLKHHRATSHIPVVLLTDRDRINDVELALELGADGYLPKHEATQQLGAVVDQFVGA
jgi:DNA-binding response OmpR family regulator